MLLQQKVLINKQQVSNIFDKSSIKILDSMYQFTLENKCPSFLATKYLAYPATSQGMSAEGAIRYLTLKLSASKTPTAPSQNPI